MQKFFSESNPWAWQAIAERLLEAVERELWEDPNPLDVALLEAAKELGLEALGQKNGTARNRVVRNFGKGVQISARE